MSDSPSHSRPSRKALGTIFLIVFIDLVGFGIVIPILPYYAQQFGASAFELGWLMTAFSLMQFIFAPFWGRISDHWGRRPVLLLSLSGSVASLLILGFAETLQTLFLGRILAGFFGANISTAYAYMTDVTSEEDRAKGMGLVGAAFGLGFIFGPAIGGILSRYGYSTPMFFGAGIALFDLILAYFVLHEPKLPPEVRSAHRSKRFDLSGHKRVLSDPRTRLAIGVFFLLTFAVTQMEVTFALSMSERFGYSAQEAGILLAIMGIIMVLMQGGLIGRLAPRFGEVRLISFGTIVCSISLVFFAVASTTTALVIALVGIAIGHGISHPSLSSLASLGADPKMRGATMGTFQSAGSLSRVLGPPAAGWLYDHAGLGSPFLFGAAVLGVAFLISWSYSRRTICL